MKLRYSVLSMFAVLLALAGFSPVVHAQQTVQIAAAANLTKVFDNQIIPEFKKETGITILATYGATGLLAKQVENGAPFEVFVSADVTTPQKLVDEHLLTADSMKTYAVGQLALWSKTLPVATQKLDILSTSSVNNISVANPKTAPYGAATIETLTSSNLLTVLQPKIVYAENISQALQYAQSGNADIAFTAYSLVKDAGGSVYIIPANLHAPIAQAFGVAPTASASALKFAAFLLSKKGQKIFAAAGYLAPSAAKH